MLTGYGTFDFLNDNTSRLDMEFNSIQGKLEGLQAIYVSHDRLAQLKNCVSNKISQILADLDLTNVNDRLGALS